MVLALCSGVGIGAGGWELFGGRAAVNAPTTAVVRVGEVPVAITPVTIDRSAFKNGLLPRAQWPNSCGLLSEEDMRSLLPDLTSVMLNAVPVYRSTPENSTAGRPPASVGKDPRAQCYYELGLPNVQPGEAVVWVRLEAIGSPRAVADYYEATARALASNATPAGLCGFEYLPEGSRYCRTRTVVFSVGGWGPTSSRSQWRDGVLRRVTEILLRRLP
ncbi:hypothetical protein [Actinocorallia lasiicapitis]